MKDLKTSTSENYATIEIGLAMLPSERYKRNVVRGALDLVGKDTNLKSDFTTFEWVFRILPTFIIN